MLLGLGTFCVVFPKVAVSQTIWNTELQGEKFAIIQADPGVANEAWQRFQRQGIKTNCQCVPYAVAVSGINVGSIGMAKNHPINSKTPSVGAIVVTSESNSGHLGVVTQIWQDTIVITEKNYIPCTVGTRELKKDSPVIRGYYEKR